MVVVVVVIVEFNVWSTPRNVCACTHARTHTDTVTHTVTSKPRSMCPKEISWEGTPGWLFLHASTHARTRTRAHTHTRTRNHLEVPLNEHKGNVLGGHTGLAVLRVRQEAIRAVAMEAAQGLWDALGVLGAVHCLQRDAWVWLWCVYKGGGGWATAVWILLLGLLDARYGWLQLLCLTQASTPAASSLHSRRRQRSAHPWPHPGRQPARNVHRVDECMRAVALRRDPKAPHMDGRVQLSGNANCPRRACARTCSSTAPLGFVFSTLFSTSEGMKVPRPA